jgi:DNA-binding response OmpR family regulator
MDTLGADTLGTILLVEDNEDIAKVTCNLLEREGFIVHHGASLADARTLIATTTIDVILLDIDLPDGNGFDFFMEIRDTLQAEVIFVSAGNTYLMEDKCKAAGAFDYISKPCDFRDLFSTVKAAIESKRGGNR